MGHDTTTKGIRELFYTKLTLVSKLQRATVEAGENPEHVNLDVTARQQAKGPNSHFHLVILQVIAERPELFEHTLISL
jgi:hypothetical protein